MFKAALALALVAAFAATAAADYETPWTTGSYDSAFIPGISALQVNGETYQPTGAVKRSTDNAAPAETAPGTGNRKMLAAQAPAQAAQDTIWVDGAEYKAAGRKLQEDSPVYTGNLDQAWIPGVSSLEAGGATWQPTGRVQRSDDAGPAPEEVPEGTGSRKLLQDTMWVDGAEYAKSG